MKTHSAIIAALATATSLVADTLQIGAFTLPYRYEDTNITDIVRYVVTNDVISFQSATTSFTPPFVEENGNVTVDGENTPDMHFYRPRVFLDGIEFRIENGQTNCIIKQSLTDAAKAIEGELPMRTNLVAGARQFIDNFCSGATTNLPFSEQRKLMRTIEGNCLSDMGEDCPNAEVTEVQGEMRQKFAFLPICVLDTEYSYIGTNRVFWAYVRADMPQNPSYARSIDALPLIYADGYWSFLY